MSTLFIALLVGILGAGAARADAAPLSSEPSIERLDRRADSVFPVAARVERIAAGFNWVEGPVWNRAEGILLFSDIPANAIYEWRPGRDATVFLKPAGYSGMTPFAGREPGSNGLAYDALGRLVICEHGDRRISRLERDGTRTALATHYRGRRLNSPNDATFHSNGDLYFTDPPFGLPGAFNDPGKELPHQGVYRLSPAGELTLLVADLKAPNGIAFSHDETTLYLTDVDPARPAWLAYDVLVDGTLANRRVFFDARIFGHNGPGGPDGLKVGRDAHRPNRDRHGDRERRLGRRLLDAIHRRRQIDLSAPACD
jgi:gluconolactonase